MNRPLIALGLALLPAIASAQSNQATEGTSGLPVPRFVSIGAGEANMRTGPGERYPISWVYRREGLPLEVIAEYGIWRKVRDPHGTTGWMNKNLLSGDRTAFVTRTIRTLHAKSDVASKPVWRVEPGTVAKIVVCEEAWCQLSIDGRSGYILRDQIWGVYREETID